jgi:hypothetical protein
MTTLIQQYGLDKVYKFNLESSQKELTKASIILVARVVFYVLFEQHVV